MIIDSNYTIYGMHIKIPTIYCILCFDVRSMQKIKKQDGLFSTSAVFERESC